MELPEEYQRIIEDFEKIKQSPEYEGKSSFGDISNLIHNIQAYSILKDDPDTLKTIEITKNALNKYLTLFKNNDKFKEIELTGNEFENEVAFPIFLSYAKSNLGQKIQEQKYNGPGMVKEHYIDLSEQFLEQKLNLIEEFNQIKIEEFNGDYFFKISSKSNDLFHEDDPNCSFLDFKYNSEMNLIEYVNLNIKENDRDKGLGKSLVKTMEIIANDLDCSSIKIDINKKPSFWEHLGYSRNNNYWEKIL